MGHWRLPRLFNLGWSPWVVSSVSDARNTASVFTGSGMRQCPTSHCPVLPHRVTSGKSVSWEPHSSLVKWGNRMLTSVLL